MINVSVIVPVYNVAPFVGRCMDSLREQTLQGVEVLFVDDHGKDDSVVRIQQYISVHQLDDSWHLLATPQNAGPGQARNVGINAARGEYVAFVDGDDWIEPTMLEMLYQQAVAHDADLSSSAAILDFPDGTHRMMMNPAVGSGEVSVAMRKHLLRHFVSNFTTMLFRREWLMEEKLPFPETKSGEDSCFMGECYLMCRRIAQCDTPVYHYVIHAESISHRKHVWRGREKRVAFGALLSFAQQRGLWRTYKWDLLFVYFKKAIATSMLDYLKSL